jgi:large subunit ribosomal protein L29
MKYADIKALPNKELVERYKEERKRYQKMQFQNAVSPLEQPHKLKESRREVARLLTELNVRRSEAQYQAYMKNNANTIEE